MPVMDGIEAMNLLKEKDGKVPIILHSSYSEYRRDPRTRVADAFVIKSSDLKELKEKISEILK
jgi:CheY-like chemotaxis protein